MTRLEKTVALAHIGNGGIFVPHDCEKGTFSGVCCSIWTNEYEPNKMEKGKKDNKNNNDDDDDDNYNGSSTNVKHRTETMMTTKMSCTHRKCWCDSHSFQDMKKKCHAFIVCLSFISIANSFCFLYFRFILSENKITPNDRKSILFFFTVLSFILWFILHF